MTSVSPTRLGVLRMTELPEAGRLVQGPLMMLFRSLFEHRDVELVDIAVHEGETPASLDDADGWIVTGSPASVYDDLPWIRTAEQIVRDLIAAERPLVGICFGHQLVAQALGGRVERAPAGWRIGSQHYETMAPVPFLDDAADGLVLLASHQDQVVEPPADAVVWSRSEHCPNAGMLIGERIWTMQAHPEFTPDVVAALYDSRRVRLGDHAVDAALRTLDVPLSNRAVADAIVRFAGGRPGPTPR